VISPTQRLLPGNNTQHLKETDIHAPGGISDPQSQEASYRKPTLYTAQPLGSAILITYETFNSFKTVD
jgi:hypothetical protein